MNRAPLGGSGVEVTALALGGGALGHLFKAVADDDALDTVRAAWDVGIRYFDVAPFYSWGLAERRVGAVLREQERSSYTLSTKVGRILDPEQDEWHWDFSADGVRRGLEASLSRLGLDRVDVVYIHDPDDHIDEAIATAYPALAALRDEGVVGAIGVGANRSSVAQPFVERCDLDCVLLAGRYTLLDRSAASEFLPLCLERGVSVVAGGVLNTGVLTNPDSPDVHYDYAPVPDHVRARARELAAIAAGHGAQLVGAALQFPARHPAVASVLVGCRSRTEIEENAAQFNAALPEALWADLA